MKTTWSAHRGVQIGVFVMMGALALSTALLGCTPAQAAPAGWTTSGTKILNPAGGQFVITGINWYGFETADHVVHGLYSKDYTYIVNEAKQYGYNTLRIPFSNEMWELNPIPGSSKLSACPSCAGKHARDILAMIVNYAGSIGLHVILDNHRSEAGNSAEGNGLWYFVSGNNNYPESSWLADWVNVQRWVHGIAQPSDTVAVNYLAADGAPIVVGYDLRNEPHTPSRTAYLAGATWGSGDGIDPTGNPNPNPFAPACVAGSTCHDWRLAAERAGDNLLGDAAANGWANPLLMVEGIGQYPAANGTAANGPYDGYWWGGSLLGVNGNANNPGAPVVFNAGGTASSLGAAVANQVVYSAHDYGPSLFQQTWFNTSTCYTSGCSASSLADVWAKNWAYINLPGGVNPAWAGHASYPWANTGQTAYNQAPIYIGEGGTGKADSDIYSSGAGSQGQWFTDLMNFIQSSNALNTTNNSGLAVTNLTFTYWALNSEDNYGLLGSSYTGLANSKKEYSFLCFVQWGPLAVPRGSGSGQCGSTGPFPNP
ncbi:MAG TPA: cellulase family glycosylhydrolase [Chloroflexia bacterium]|nr:cellulase family glycosylhydrolase [Chloroflexia bacterium]